MSRMERRIRAMRALSCMVASAEATVCKRRRGRSVLLCNRARRDRAGDRRRRFAFKILSLRTDAWSHYSCTARSLSYTRPHPPTRVTPARTPHSEDLRPSLRCHPVRHQEEIERGLHEAGADATDGVEEDDTRGHAEGERRLHGCGCSRSVKVWAEAAAASRPSPGRRELFGKLAAPSRAP